MSSDTTTWVSKYVVVRAGDHFRSEHMNVAVLLWRTNVGPASPVSCRMLQDWTRIKAAFGWKTDELKDDIIARITAIKTEEDYDYVSTHMSIYTPFEFSDERPTIDPKDREEIIDELAKHFLVEPKPVIVYTEP